MVVLMEEKLLEKTEAPLSLSITQLPFDGRERREKQRVCESFPIRVRGTDASGEAFEVDMVLENISATGLYVRLTRNVKRGANLFIIVRLSPSDRGADSAPLIAMLGKVRRAEQEANGSWGVAVEFTRHRFI
jgi:c-di-GMP-binding flagellar brake protein YcgR